MNSSAPRVVFDCVIFAQALISDRGPAAACLEYVRAGAIHLLWSDYILQEIRELPAKLPVRLNVTSEQVEAFLLAIAPYVEHVATIPETYENPFDKDDSHYINLAVAASARLITTRDHDLLRLMDVTIHEGQEFHSLFPNIQIISPEALLMVVRTMA